CVADTRRCHPTTGVPQTCDGTSTWVNAAACTGGNVCTAGACACPAGSTSCGGTCVDLATSAAHCNACNHSCQGGLCVARQCQAVRVAANASGIAELVVVGADVFFNEPGQVWKVSNGLITSFAAPAAGNTVERGLASDGTSLYWTRTDGTFRAAMRGALAGGGSGVLFGSTMGHLRTAGASLFHIDATETIRRSSDNAIASNGKTLNRANDIGAIMRQPYFAEPGRVFYFTFPVGGTEEIHQYVVGSGDQLLYSTTADVRSITTDGTNVYFGTYPGLARIPVSATSTTAQPLDAGPTGSVMRVLVDGTDVYWMTVTWGTQGGCVNTKIVKQPKSGTTSQVLSSTDSRCGKDMVMDGNSVYWSMSASCCTVSAEDVIMKVAK
ncbi:MAG: hypothetical protein H7X95_10915, partial [Deltaproteobacteria bacterium]|nr:hypothetical protein [Deltaproteobacteria bacterium]